ncbi:MAG TPA: NlpC/P60 family protein [Propionibacteriaceae bacterium]|nr:NlpC/P60 family protein [Propionibacteriaceae bacterium]
MLATSVGLSVALAVPASTPAAADPPLTVAEAKARIDQLETDASAIDQEYVEIKDQLDKKQAKLKLKQADVKAQTARVAKLKFQVGQVALAKFQNRNLDTAAQLFVTPDTEGFLSQISTVEKVSENQNSVLQEYQQQQARLAESEHSAETDLAALAEQEKQLKALRKASDKKIAEAKSVLAKLSAEQRRRIAAEERRAIAAAQAEAERDDSATKHKSTTQKTTHKTTTSDETPAATSGSRGARALAFARAQLGKPYRYASSGPDAYDCSGLTYAAWKSVGVSLPRSSRSQYGVGSYVAKSNLQPGDLVFFYSPISHVALYAGNGTVLHAPRPGKVVQYIKMSYMPYAGAKRPG